ncbi:hypothetical protein RhiLY_08635 [Ceratobasidium sp. AG-Ba]|nr:hypothetical protein RhiLY_08635 [Ceratobasidium sp. AG-Ba]
MSESEANSADKTHALPDSYLPVHKRTRHAQKVANGDPNVLTMPSDVESEEPSHSKKHKSAVPRSSRDNPWYQNRGGTSKRGRGRGKGRGNGAGSRGGRGKANHSRARKSNAQNNVSLTQNRSVEDNVGAEVDELPDEPIDIQSTPSPPPQTPKIKIKVPAANCAAKDAQVAKNNDKSVIAAVIDGDYDVTDDDEDPPKPQTTFLYTVQQRDIRSRPMSFSPNVQDYEQFCNKIGAAFGERPSSQELIYKTSRMLNANKWQQLNNQEDFQAMIEDGEEWFALDIRKWEAAVAKNKANKIKARKNKKAFVPLPIPPVPNYTVNIRDLHQEANNKETTKKGKEKPKEEPASAGRFKDAGHRISELVETFKARKCAKCNKSCVIVPVPGRQDPEHIPLTDSAAKMWAHLADALPLKSLQARRNGKVPTQRDPVHSGP